MTLNVTLIGDEWVVQAADRRISGNGAALGEQNKTIVFTSDRLRACVVYAGLANHPDSKPFVDPGGQTMDFESTDVWLSQVLGDRRLVNADMAGVVSVLREAADKRWSDLPDDWQERALLITVAGWDMTTNNLVVGRVANFLDDEGGVDIVHLPFTGRALDPTRRAYVAGSIDAHDKQMEERNLDRVARVYRSKEHVIDAVVAMIRRIAAARTDTVSPDPVVVWLPADGDATAQYCPPGESERYFLPNFVSCTGGAGFVLGGPTLFGSFPPGHRVGMGKRGTPQFIAATPVPRKVPRPEHRSKRSKRNRKPLT